MSKYAVEYALNSPVAGVKLTGGRLFKAFRNNIAFLKGFDTDRILHPYRAHAGAYAPGVEYCWQSGHFERNLKGQTAGEFLMGACTSLLWTEDTELRQMSDRIVEEIDKYKRADGLLLPITDEEWHTKEYPNYTRAWLTFGLLDAGYAGNATAFKLAREFTDFFNHSDVLPYVKDMNLGFQGILVNTRVYDSPIGTPEDIEVNEKAYVEEWWLKQLIAGDHKAIYMHPGNHPHSTLLTALEGYLDLYRITGKQLYFDAVKAALPMYEDKWQHVGGGINMCEDDTFYPGCNWLSMQHNYNELCSTNFWVLLNRRMRLLDRDNAHYADEIENSVYNVLLAAQVGDRGYHYLNFLEGGKDSRFLDRCTCCAAMGSRLAGLLPSLLYAYDADTVYVDLYAESRAVFDMQGGQARLEVHTDMPDGGSVLINVQSETPFKLKLRIPRWAQGLTDIYVNGEKRLSAAHGYACVAVRNGDSLRFAFQMGFKLTEYSGGEQIINARRYALEYGPLLYAALGPSVVHLNWDVTRPAEELTVCPGELRKILVNRSRREYRAYSDIDDEPFSVYPVIE